MRMTGSRDTSVRFAGRAGVQPLRLLTQVSTGVTAQTKARVRRAAA
jgi:hypothetical protein